MQDVLHVAGPQSDLTAWLVQMELEVLHMGKHRCFAFRLAKERLKQQKQQKASRATEKRQMFDRERRGGNCDQLTHPSPHL